MGATVCCCCPGSGSASAGARAAEEEDLLGAGSGSGPEAERSAAVVDGHGLAQGSEVPASPTSTPDETSPEAKKKSKGSVSALIADTRTSLGSIAVGTKASFGLIASEFGGLSTKETYSHLKEGLADAKLEAMKQLSDRMDMALSSSDDTAINALLDSAMASSVLGKGAPSPVRKAAQAVAKWQLAEAIQSENTKRLKGALVSAKRLHATDSPEFEEAVQKYKTVRKIPAGWDFSKMVMHRKGDKMVAKLELGDPAVLAKFQLLLDLTHRKVYTRDRKGEAVPERLELVRVAAVTNDDLWADYMARREAVRQELESDSSDIVHYDVATVAGSGAVHGNGESAESIARSLAMDFAEPLLSEINEVFLFHGTGAAAAEAITTNNFRINLAGSNTGTLYGRGLYLAENATKSDEYAAPLPNGERHLLLCRAVLGRVHYSAEVETDPRACEAACTTGKFHSILGDRKLCRGTFREFVIFDEEQIYANYVLTYRRR
eukprot:TRINITY_DN59599_c0_g1_i1.p1 TRINITY_DN59599_c0_g1~~TRINITY_DN59599_c0_g1_i1.p1  ORF type:complete len:491 (+),score=89.02 TRINITY_DN59599_c0_g1_i1:28-1500(+)